MLCSLSGLPIAYNLVPANTDERQVIRAVISQVRGSDVYGDKGFMVKISKSRSTVPLGIAFGQSIALTRPRQKKQQENSLKPCHSKGVTPNA
jgi:hypothetical protein